MDKLIALITLALVNKQVIEFLKGAKFVEKYAFYFSILTGLAIAATINIDLLELAGFEVTNHYVGVFLTGLGIGSGSNVIFDAFNKKPTAELIQLEPVEFEATHIDVDKLANELSKKAKEDNENV